MKWTDWNTCYCCWNTIWWRPLFYTAFKDTWSMFLNKSLFLCHHQMFWFGPATGIACKWTNGFRCNNSLLHFFFQDVYKSFCHLRRPAPMAMQYLLQGQWMWVRIICRNKQLFVCIENSINVKKEQLGS